MALIRTSALVFALVLFSVPASAQRLPLRHFTIADGLAHNVITALYDDALGYLWVGTLEGTSRFDGTTFVSHGRKDGLPGPLVTAFAETADGRIWLATSPVGVFEFSDSPRPSGTNDPPQAFRRVLISRERRTRANRVYSIAIDGETLWAGTDGGLYRGSTRPGADQFEKVLDTSEAEDGAPAFRDSRGRLWMGLRNRILSLSDGGRVIFELPAAAQPNDIVGITEDAPGALIVAGLRGIFRRASPESAFAPLPVTLQPDETVLSAEAVGRTLWLGTSHGLLRVDDGRTTRYSEEHGITAPVLTLHQRQGALWIGSTDGLRVMAHGRSTGFAPPGSARPVLKTIPLGGTEAIAATSASLFATDSRDATPSSAGARVMRGPQSTWWWATDDAILMSRGPRPSPTAAITLGIPHGLTARTSLFHDPTQPAPAMHTDAAGRVWLAMADDRLVRCAVESAAPRCEDVPHAGASWRQRPIALTDDRGGTLWIAWTNGLARLRGDRAEMVRLRDSSAGQPELAPAAFVDSRGWLWVGTHHEGVAVSRDPRSAAPTFEFVETSSGLSSQAVYSIAEIGARRYLATGRGVDAIDTSGATLRAEPVDIGFDTGVVQDLAVADGVLWIAAGTGVFRYDTAAPAPTPTPLTTYIRRLFVRGAEWTLPERGVAQLGPLTLQPAQDDVRLEFIAPAVNDPRRRYQYRIEPGPGSWSEPQPERTLTLAKLQPGSYTVQVRVVSTDRESQPAVFRFVLRAPVWQRWWFRTLAVAGILAAALAVQRIRLNRALALERIRSQIAADLHDDVGSRLAEIAIFGELGKRQASGEAHDRFDQIASTARDVRQAMSDVVWAVDPRRDHVGDLVTRLRMASETLLDPDVDVQVTASAGGVEAHLPLGPHERRQLLLIAREALVNVQKHARATRVTVSCAVDRGILTIEIADDGIGLPAAGRGEGHGLMSMERRAAALGGTLSVEALSAGGTRVVARVPLRGRRRRPPNV